MWRGRSPTTARGSAGHAAVDLRALSGSALVGYPLGWEVRTLSDRALRSSGVEPRYAFEVNDTRMLLDLVEIGLGVAVFPEAIAAPRGADCVRSRSVADVGTGRSAPRRLLRDHRTPPPARCGRCCLTKNRR